MIPLFLAVPLTTADTCAPLNRTFVPDHGWAEVWRRGPHGGRGLEGQIDRTKARVPSDPKLSHCSCDFVLVGLRADLRSTRPASELVTRASALEAAEEFSNERLFLNKTSTQRWSAPYLECSAKTGEGVDEVLAAAAAVRYPALPAGIDPRRYE